MQAMPHHYRASAEASITSHVQISAEGVRNIESTPPPEFDGPEGYSPTVLSCHLRPLQQRTNLSG